MILRLVSVLLLLLFASVPASAHEQKFEHLTIADAWTRATAPSQKVGAVFMKIASDDETGDRLIGATSPNAETVQIHGHTMDGNVMRMRQVDGIAIPAEGQAVLAPGGFHIMLIGLKAPQDKDSAIRVILEFEKAGKVEIDAIVEAAGARHATSDVSKPMPAMPGTGGHVGHGNSAHGDGHSR